jgi:hypothetical protein
MCCLIAKASHWAAHGQALHKSLALPLAHQPPQQRPQQMMIGHKPA